MLVDTHMHSEYSEDAKPNASVDAICRAAIKRGLDVIALTDHKDFMFTKPPTMLDIDAQRRDIAAAQSRYAGELTVLSGVELGQIHASAQARAYADAYAFDEVIGSVHVRRSNDTDIYFQNFGEMDCDAFLREYFNEMLAMVRVGGFDILAHIEYPLRVMKRDDNHPSFDGFMAQIEPILRELIGREIALEINAAGLFGWLKAAGPAPQILELYRNLGGTMVTVGSDSHCAPDVGRGIEECYACAKRAGFRELIIYKKRKPSAISL